MFNAFEELDQNFGTKLRNQIHIRIKQRTARTHITSISGIDLTQHVTALRKYLCCGVSQDLDENDEKIFKIQGDHRDKIQKFLIDKGLATKDEIKIHGF